MSRYYANEITNARWDKNIVSLESLTDPRNIIEVVFPENKYLGNSRAAPMVAYFNVKEELGGTPRSAFSQVTRNYSSEVRFDIGDVAKYVEGNNVWFFNKYICILNGFVAYVVLPTDPKTLVIGTNLMAINSKMAKFIKEKIVPELDFVTLNVVIQDTYVWPCPNNAIRKPVTQEELKMTLLSHVDDLR